MQPHCRWAHHVVCGRPSLEKLFNLIMGLCQQVNNRCQSNSVEVGACWLIEAKVIQGSSSQSRNICHGTAAVSSVALNLKFNFCLCSQKK